MGKYYTCDVSFIFNLNEDKCNHCMSCVKYCSYDALHFENNEFIIDANKCSRCESCVGVCPTGAIQVKFKYGEMKDVSEGADQKIFIANIRKSDTGVS